MDDEKLDEIIGDVYCEGFNRGQEAMIQVFTDMGLINEKLADVIRKGLGYMEFDEHYDSEHEKKVIKTAAGLIGR